MRQREIRKLDEEKAVSPVIATILMVAITVVLAGVLYVWANNLASEGTDTSIGTFNTYTTEDAEDETGPGAEDTLVKLQMTGKDDLAWAFVKVTVSVEDNVYTCSIMAGDDCQIRQEAGDDDNSWEPGEYLFLSEGNEDICSSSECALEISITHNGRVVAGDQSSGQAGNVGSGTSTDEVHTSSDAYVSFSGEGYNPDYEYVIVEDSNSLSIEGEFTFSSWMYPTSFDGDWRNLYDIPDAHMMEFSPDGKPTWRAENSVSPGWSVSSDDAIAAGEWTHIACTMTQTSDGYTITMYINGEVVAYTSNTNIDGVVDSDNDLYLGVLWSQQNNPDPWNGGIDDFKFWNKALTSSQISQVYSNSNSVESNHLVLDLSFNSVSGDAVEDMSGQGNDGVIVGGEIVSGGAN